MTRGGFVSLGLTDFTEDAGVHRLLPGGFQREHVVISLVSLVAPVRSQVAVAPPGQLSMTMVTSPASISNGLTVT